MKSKNTRRGNTQINWVGQALPDNAPAKGHLAGFTLIELLVVVLIIGILAAVAVPQYQKAVKRAQGKEVYVALNALDKAFSLFTLEHGSLDEMICEGKDCPVEKLDIAIPELKYFTYARYSGSTKLSPNFFALGSNTDISIVGNTAKVDVKWDKKTGKRISAICNGKDCDAFFNCYDLENISVCSVGIPLYACPENLVIPSKRCSLD